MLGGAGFRPPTVLSPNISVVHKNGGFRTEPYFQDIWGDRKKSRIHKPYIHTAYIDEDSSILGT